MHEHEYKVKGGTVLSDEKVGVTHYRCWCGETRNKYDPLPDFSSLPPEELEDFALALLKTIDKESVDKLRNTVYTEEYFKGVA